MSKINPIKADVEELAEALSRAQQEVLQSGMINVSGLTSEERVKIDAAHRIATDKRDRAQQDYWAAFRKWADAGYPESITDHPALQHVSKGAA